VVMSSHFLGGIKEVFLDTRVAIGGQLIAGGGGGLATLLRSHQACCLSRRLLE
jgi:hypothetical protein